MRCMVAYIAFVFLVCFFVRLFVVCLFVCLFPPNRCVVLPFWGGATLLRAEGLPA